MMTADSIKQHPLRDDIIKILTRYFRHEPPEQMVDAVVRTARDHFPAGMAVTRKEIRHLVLEFAISTSVRAARERAENTGKHFIMPSQDVRKLIRSVLAVDDTSEDLTADIVREILSKREHG